jgi:peptidoglycan/xylan/chitin deacetylase (PgdA/CDA1 family)
MSPRSRLHLDRMLTLYCFGPLVGRNAEGKRKERFPILMYHSVAGDDKETRHPYYGLTTTPAAFSSQMDYLHRNNYLTLGLSEAFEHKHDGRDATKVVVLTFDDGFHDFFTDAFPILQRYGFSATVFLPTGYIGNKRNSFKGRDCLVWDEVKELHAGGIKFGSHTVTHPQLQILHKKDIRAELQCSKETIENNLGVQIQDFSYPYAFPEKNSSFKSYVMDTLAGCGYRNAVTTRIGTADTRENRYLTRRIPMNSRDDITLMEAKLKGFYDWMKIPQYLYKLIKEIKPR